MMIWNEHWPWELVVQEEYAVLGEEGRAKETLTFGAGELSEARMVVVMVLYQEVEEGWEGLSEEEMDLTKIFLRPGLERVMVVEGMELESGE